MNDKCHNCGCDISGLADWDNIIYGPQYCSKVCVDQYKTKDLVDSLVEIAMDRSMAILNRVDHVGFLSSADVDTITDSALKIFNAAAEIKNKKIQNNR